jgi:hypothetical protein
VRLGEEELRKLVSRLHTSGKATREEAQREQHRLLAEELRGLSFKPAIGDLSRALAKGNKMLLERQQDDLRRREERVEQERRRREEEEVAGCTFEPTLMSASETARIVGLTHHGGRKVEDMLRFAMERDRRREDLRRHQEQREAEELTFKPKICAASRRLAGNLNRDAVTRQTCSPQKFRPTFTCRDVGHEQETFEPMLISRALGWRGGDDVYVRLYREASERTERLHNEAVRLYRESLKGCAIRRHEAVEKEGPGPGVWVQEAHESKEAAKRRAEEELMRASEDTVVTVVRYVPRMDGLVRRMNPHFAKE